MACLGSAIFLLQVKDENVHGRIQRGDRGSGPLAENHKNIGFPSNIDPDPQLITKLPSQHSMVGHHGHASETPFQ